MRPARDKEISCRITRTLLMYVRERNNGSLGNLLEGLELDHHYLMDTNNWVSHAFLQVLYHRMIQILGEENAVYSMTLASERFQSLGLLDRIVRLIGTPKLIYGQAPKLNKLLKLNGDVFIQEMGKSWVLLEDRYHNSAQKTRYDCDYTRGVLAGIPTMFGMPLADVEETECQVRAEVYGGRVWPDHPAYGARGCLYRVHWKGAKSGFPLKRFFAGRSIYERAIQDLQEANQQIQEKYDEARHLATSLEKSNAALTVSKSKLESSERRYRLLAENASDIIWTLNLETMRFDYVSPSVLRVRGFTPYEAMEMSLEKTLTPPSYELALKVTAEELERDGKEGLDPNRSRTLEVRQACKDGSFAWAEATMTFIRNEEGRPVGVLGATRDIRDRKRAEQALRESEQRLNRAQEIAHLGSWELDLVNNRLTWSDEVYRIFGIAPQEFGATYEAFLECVHPDDRAAVDAGYSGSLRENLNSYEVEHRVVRKDTGGIRFVHEKCEHFRDAAGKIIRSVGMVHDVTERKRAEEALRRSRDELELRVRERTLELETYLKELQESNKALQDFASIASHDMQEPLRKIITFGDILKESHSDSLGTEAKDYLDRMLNASTRMRSLLKSLHDYSSVTTQTQSFRKVDLAVIIREVLADLELVIEKAGGEVRVNELPLVEADVIQMRKLFWNLIGNALKFHKEGESPYVEVLGRSLADRMAEIVVKDNGIGFDEKYLERIFVPFQRLHGHSEYEGTGMGLAICKKIVERHGWTITAESAPGKGSTFIITLSRKQMQPKKES